MPPKVKHTKEKIITAAFEVIQQSGVENLNARAVAEHIGCSTQPVMYHFKTIDELRQEVYKYADDYHTGYIMQFRSENQLLDIGMNYIQFARGEPHLFRFLFQSNGLAGKSISELVDSEELQPLFEIMTKEADTDIGTAKCIFRSICMVAHGYASMLANNMIDIDEDAIETDLSMVFTGAMLGANSMNDEGDK